MLLYIHVPFCRQKCAYCAFYSVGLRQAETPYSSPARQNGLPEGTIPAHDDTLLDRYCQILITEIAARSQSVTTPIRSIFFGGGTPSLLSAQHLDSILGAIQRHYSLETHMEITVEANPESALRPHWLRDVRQAGVNRLSLGIQSFTDSDLTLLGRCHSAAQARDALRLAHEAQFPSISLDLMWALPWFTSTPRPLSPVAHWLATLEAALEWSPHHISAYGLILEDDTPLAKLAHLSERAELAKRADSGDAPESPEQTGMEGLYGHSAHDNGRTMPSAEWHQTPDDSPKSHSQQGQNTQRPGKETGKETGARRGGIGGEIRDTHHKEYPLDKRLAFPSEEEEQIMYLRGIELLARHGLEHYEISNFALPGHQCRHNIGYWQGRNYLGFGPSAVSTLGMVRFTNEPDFEGWARGIQSGRPQYAMEKLSAHALQEEKIMLSLRMAQGLALADWNRLSPRPLPELPLVRQLVQDGLAYFTGQNGGRFALTPSGMLVSNAIISRLFEEVPDNRQGSLAPPPTP